jgi:hypothetical protein
MTQDNDCTDRERYPSNVVRTTEVNRHRPWMPLRNVSAVDPLPWATPPVGMVLDIHGGNELEVMLTQEIAYLHATTGAFVNVSALSWRIWVSDKRFDTLVEAQAVGLGAESVGHWAIYQEFATAALFPVAKRFPAGGFWRAAIQLYALTVAADGYVSILGRST